MEADVQNRLDTIEKKVDAIYVSTEKTRKYFKLIFWITIVAFVIPLIALVFIIPFFANSYLGSFGDLLK